MSPLLRFGANSPYSIHVLAGRQNGWIRRRHQTPHQPRGVLSKRGYSSCQSKACQASDPLGITTTFCSSDILLYTTSSFIPNIDFDTGPPPVLLRSAKNYALAARPARCNLDAINPILGITTHSTEPYRFTISTRVTYAPLLAPDTVGRRPVILSSLSRVAVYPCGRSTERYRISNYSPFLRRKVVKHLCLQISVPHYKYIDGQ